MSIESLRAEVWRTYERIEAGVTRRETGLGAFEPDVVIVDADAFQRLRDLCGDGS